MQHEDKLLMTKVSKPSMFNYLVLNSSCASSIFLFTTHGLLEFIKLIGYYYHNNVVTIFFIFDSLICSENGDRNSVKKV